MARRNGEAGVSGRVAVGRRSDRFLAGLSDATRVTFVSHVHPDPDSLGSMMGLAHLVETNLGIPTRMTRDGPISRAENKAMVELLNLDLVPIGKIEWQEGEALVMVDSQPNTGRHSLDPAVPLYGVIDHHDTKGDLEDIPEDVRKTLSFHPVATLDEVFAIALLPAPEHQDEPSGQTMMEVADQSEKMPRIPTCWANTSSVTRRSPSLWRASSVDW